MVLSALVGLHSAAAGTVVIPAVRDNTLFSDPDGALSSGAGAHLFAGNNSVSNTRRAVIAFDIAAYLPVGATVDSVALVLNVSSAPNETPQSVTLHRVLADWGEGASVSSGGAGAASETGDATWLHTFYPNDFWSAPGGDFAAAPSASQTVTSTGVHTWSGAPMVADVQQWLDHPETAFGWLLRADETAASTVRRFDSRENGTESNRPYLFVAYTIDTTATQTTSWGALKSRYSRSPEPSTAAPDAAPEDP